MRAVFAGVLLFGVGALSPLAAQSATDVQVSPPEVDLVPGARVQVGATAFTERGDAIVGASYRWTSTDSGVVRVVADKAMGIAVLTGVAPGAAVIEVRSGKGRGFATVVVTGAGGAAGPPAEAPATAEARRRLTTCTQLSQKPPAGSWAQWKTEKGIVRLALLGTEERMGERLNRIEMAAGDGAERPGTVAQLLSEFWPYTGQRLYEVLLHVPGRPLRRLSAQQLASTRLQTPPNPLGLAAGRCKELSNLGPVSVTVPAGTFTAHHFRDADGQLEIWIDPTVPFGLVKTAGSTSGWVELVARGSGAVSSIENVPSSRH